MDIKTIENKIENTIIIDKSRFITYLFPCDSKENANDLLNELRNIHKEATHVCYAYIIEEDNVLLYKSSDDGEPSQTAGAPILNVIKKNGLCNIICAVVRYFGGIKLGAGGLVRAYSSSAAEAVNKASIVTLVEAFKHELIFPYERISVLDKFFDVNNVEIIDKKYEMEVSYTIITYDKEQIINMKKKIEYLNVRFVDLGVITTRKKIQ